MTGLRGAAGHRALFLPPLPLPTGLSHFLPGCCRCPPTWPRRGLQGWVPVRSKRELRVEAALPSVPPRQQSAHLENGVMLCVLDTLELYIPCILKRNRTSALVWNTEGDSAGMDLCHQGAWAVAGTTNPPPHLLSIHLSSEANGFQGLPGEVACSLQLPGRGSCPSLQLKGGALRQSPLPAEI